MDPGHESQMNSYPPARQLNLPGGTDTGSILLYVLWILVVISVLAFQLTSASRATTLNQSAFTQQLKKQMQIDSAVQFAIFKILANSWQGRTFKFNLNGQAIAVSVHNEAGYVSIYDLANDLLRSVFEFAGVDEASVQELDRYINDEDREQRFNSFEELRRIPGIDDTVLRRLIPLISVFHEEPINPMQSPPQLLMQIHRVDQFRVQKLIDASDEQEKADLRRELVESLSQRDLNLSEDLSTYFRANVEIDDVLYRVFLRSNRSSTDYKVVMIDSGGIAVDKQIFETEDGN